MANEGVENEAYKHMSIGKAQSLGTDKVNEIFGLKTEDYNSNLDTDDTDTDDADTEKEEDKEKYVLNTISSNDKLQAKYGLRQKVIIANKEDNAVLKAQRIFHENSTEEESISVEVLGDLSYRVGWGVHFMSDYLGSYYNDCFMYIKEVEHEFKAGGIFTTSLVLTKSRVMDEKEWSDVKDSEDSEGKTGGSALWSKIKPVFEQQIGKPYEWAAAGSDSFDCSGLMMYVFNQFSDETGVTLTHYTGDQCKSGDAVNCNSTDEIKDACNPGDLLFFVGSDGSKSVPGHVGCYWGDGKMIHAPGRGDVVKIVDLTRQDFCCARRILPEEVEANDEDNTILMGGYSQKYVELLKDFEGYFDHWYDDGGGTMTIGYGTAVTSATGKRIWNSGKKTCTEKEAEGWMKEELNSVASEVTKIITSTGGSMNQRCFDVSVDIKYQWGGQRDSIIRMLATGDIEGAKAKIRNLGYPRRDKCRIKMLDGDYSKSD